MFGEENIIGISRIGIDHLKNEALNIKELEKLTKQFDDIFHDAYGQSHVDDQARVMIPKIIRDRFVVPGTTIFQGNRKHGVIYNNEDAFVRTR